LSEPGLEGKSSVEDHDATLGGYLVLLAELTVLQGLFGLDFEGHELDESLVLSIFAGSLAPYYVVSHQHQARPHHALVSAQGEKDAHRRLSQLLAHHRRETGRVREAGEEELAQLLLLLVLARP